MMLDRTASRLAIYFFFDRDGVVDGYVPFMLEDLRRNCERVLVVVNGSVNAAGRQRLVDVVGEGNLLVRENVGFDVWAYKTALEHVGWDAIGRYDEVVFMNFTVFGPVYPLAEMFGEMDGRELDFWGITKHYGATSDPSGCIPGGRIPEHIQSLFIAVRRSMLTSAAFREYWEGMPEINRYWEAVGRHEAIFTRHFEKKGFKSGVYVDTDDLREATAYPLMIKPLELVKNRRCPVFKRKSFTGDYFELLESSAGEPTRELYDYLKASRLYDLDMVWENVLRTGNMASVKQRMQLNFVFPQSSEMAGSADARVALVAHVYYPDLAAETLLYAKSMPEDADVYVTVASDEAERAVGEVVGELRPRNVRVIRIENRGRDVSALLVGAAPYLQGYDYVCFVHDKKTLQVRPWNVGMSWSRKCLESLLASRAYVRNVIRAFNDEPRLGMLMPSPPIHGVYAELIGAEWSMNFDNTKELAQKLGIRANINPSEEPISPLGTMFWFRTAALSGLLERQWAYSDFPKEPNGIDGTMLHAMERLYGLAAQDMGFYSGWCATCEQASMELTNYRTIYRELNSVVGSRYGHLPVLKGLHEPVSGVVNLGVAGALKIWINKNVPFLFREFAKANRSLQVLGVRGSLRCWLMKKL